MLKRILPLALLAGLIGCSDSPTELTAENAVLDILGGNLQEARVTEELPEPLRVEVRAGTQPVPGVVVCFVATTNGAGEPWSPCTQTDGNGRASTPWTLGTVARAHTIEARAVVDEEALALASFQIRAWPGPVSTIQMPDQYIHWLGEERELSNLVTARDAHGNAWPSDSITWSGVEGPTWAPELEGYDTLTATADGVSRDLEVVSLIRIEAGWRHYLQCEDGNTRNSSIVNDSIKVFMEIDSVTLGGGLEEEGYPVRGEFHGSSGWDVWRPGAEEPTHTMRSETLTPGFHQRPGEALLGLGVPWHPVYADDNPPEYFSNPDDACGGTSTTVEAWLRPPEAG